MIEIGTDGSAQISASACTIGHWRSEPRGSSLRALMLFGSVELRVRQLGMALVAVLAVQALSGPAAHGEVLRVGKAVPEEFSFVPLDVGVRYGFFKKYGLEIETSAYN